jgi:transcriptional regulator with XRE-family HTH domain
MSNFGRRVTELRDRLGLKQRTLAQRVGLTPSHLNKIEKGVRNAPAVETILSIIQVLHLNRKEAEELVQLAGYSPKVLQVGGGLVYNAPSLEEAPLPTSFERFLTALGKLATLPRQQQEECIERMIDFIEFEVTGNENGNEDILEKS